MSDSPGLRALVELVSACVPCAFILMSLGSTSLLTGEAVGISISIACV